MVSCLFPDQTSAILEIIDGLAIMAKRRRGSDEGIRQSNVGGNIQGQHVRGNGAAVGKIIRTSQDLQSLLSTTRLELETLIVQVKAFKSFLDGIGNTESKHQKSSDHKTKISILLDYLHLQFQASDEEATSFVPDVIKFAHHAGEVNSENLFSITVTVQALLLKIISPLHEARNVGNRLCRLLLDESHAKLLEYGMNAAKSKEHLISPCLRLLREVVLFDGGRAAEAVYRSRRITFRRLDVFLTMRGETKDDEDGTRKRQTVRSAAISFILANIRLQSPAAKSYILGQSRWARMLLSDMDKDPPGLILGLLDALQKEVVENEILPFAVKEQFFDEWTLGRLASLYDYDNHHPEHSSSSVATSVHTLLKTACSSPGHGLLVTVQGEQGQDNPSGVHDADDAEDAKFREASVKRTQIKILSFLRRLRPHASIPQSELIIACFQIAPSLLDQYFFGQSAFSFEPKLSATWVGYSQFILGVIQQPLQERLIDKYISGEDHSLQLLTHSILPPPLTKTILTQCINKSSRLLNLIAARILVAAFEKFAAAQRILDLKRKRRTMDSITSPFKKQNSLRESFSKRLPKVNDVIVQFKNCPSENTMLHECLSRLLMLYHIRTPGLVVQESVDVSSALSTALANLEGSEAGAKRDGMLLIVGKHAVEIASRSPEMDWWHQRGTSSNPLPSLYKSNVEKGTLLSPYTNLLRYCVNQSEDDRIRKIVKSVAEEGLITWPGTPIAGFDVLALSLQFQAQADLSNIYAFLDNCFQRVSKRSVIFAEQLQDHVNSYSRNGTVETERRLPDLLMVACYEQLSYLIHRQSGMSVATEVPVAAVTRFVATYMNLSALQNVDGDILYAISLGVMGIFPPGDPHRPVIDKALKEPLDREAKAALQSLRRYRSEGCQQHPQAKQQVDEEVQPKSFVPGGPPVEDDKHRGLTRWTREGLFDSITSGAIKELLLCLCSAHEEIRKQGLACTKVFMKKLEVGCLPTTVNTANAF